MSRLLPSIRSFAISLSLAATSSIAGALPSLAATQVEPAAPESFGWKEGQLLPDLELPRIDGQGSMRLSALRGQRVILIQFASW